MFTRSILLSAALGTIFLIPSIAEAGYIGWPASGNVTSPYGPRSSPCSGCSTFHYGIDIGVPSGTNLGSPGNGTVSSWVWSSCGGNIYTIGYGNGWQTRFLHCSSAVVGVGTVVSRNTTVAKSGNTGSCTTGAHLHFEVRKDGVAQSIPGNKGDYVTRNNNVPKDYPGLNDPASTTITVDNNTSYFSVVGSWSTGTSAADKYGTDYRFKSTAAVSEPASWTRALPSSGSWKIYAWWPAGTNRSATAPYILPDGAVVNVNQQTNGGKWNLLGTKSISGTVVTKLSVWTTTGYVVMADAIRYVK